MKLKHLEPGMLVAIGSRSSMQLGELSQALVLGVGFGMKYVKGIPMLEKNSREILLAAPIKEDTEYPLILLDHIKDEEDDWVKLSRILEMHTDLKKCGIVIASYPIISVQMPWLRWMKEKPKILKDREREQKDALKTNAENKKRYDEVQEQLFNLGVDLDAPVSHSKRFTVSLSLDQAEKVLYIIDNLKSRVSLN